MGKPFFSKIRYKTSEYVLICARISFFLLIFMVFPACNDSEPQEEELGLEEEVELVDDDENDEIVPPQYVGGAFLTGVKGTFKPSDSAPLDSVAGARIYVLEDFNFEAYTNPLGAMNLELSPGVYTILILSKDGEWGIKLTSVEVKEGEVNDLGTQFLQKTASISGNAKLYGANEHSGIEIFVPGTSFIGRSDNAGIFKLPNLPEGEYNLRVEKSGYLPIDLTNVILESGEDTKIENVVLSLSLGPEGTFTVKHENTLKKDQLELPIVGKETELNISYDSDALLMRISTNENFTDSRWQDVSQKSKISFSSEGLHDIYIQFQGEDGLESGTVRKSVFVDYNPPGLELINLQYGANSTHQKTIHFEIIGQDKASDINGSGISHYMVSDSSDFSGSQWLEIKTGLQLYEYTLTKPPGTLSLYFKLRDFASFESTVKERSITYAPAEISLGEQSIPKILSEGVTRFESSSNSSGTTAYLLHRDFTDEYVKGLFAMVDSNGQLSELHKLDDSTNYYDFKTAVNDDGYIFALWTTKGDNGSQTRAAYLNPTDSTWKSVTDLEGASIGSIHNFNILTQKDGFYLFLSGYQKSFPEDHAIVSRFFSLTTLKLETDHLIQSGIGHISYIQVAKDSSSNMIVSFATEGRDIFPKLNDFKYDSYAIMADKNGNFESAPTLLSSTTPGFAEKINATSPQISSNDSGFTAALWCENDSNDIQGDSSFFIRTKNVAENWSSPIRLSFPIDIDNSNNQITFKSDAGTFTATIDSKKYLSIEELINSIKTAMHSADSSHTYEINIDMNKGRVNLSSTSSSIFEVLFGSGTNQVGAKLGFTKNDLSSNTNYQAENFYQPEIQCKATNHWVSVDNSNNIDILWNHESSSALYYTRIQDGETKSNTLVSQNLGWIQKGTLKKISENKGVLAFYTRSGIKNDFIKMYTLQFTDGKVGKPQLMDSFEDNKYMIRFPEVRSTFPDAFVILSIAQKPKWVHDSLGIRVLWNSLSSGEGPDLRYSTLRLNGD